MTDSSTKCAWVIHESKAVQIHVHNNRRYLYEPRVPGSVKNLHNNKYNGWAGWASGECSRLESGLSWVSVGRSKVRIALGDCYM